MKLLRTSWNGDEPDCPRCKNFNALLHHLVPVPTTFEFDDDVGNFKVLPWIIGVKCRDCGLILAPCVVDNPLCPSCGAKSTRSPRPPWWTATQDDQADRCARCDNNDEDEYARTQVADALGAQAGYER